MFGNPGSTELPMLHDFPDDFRYVLGPAGGGRGRDGRRLRPGERRGRRSSTSTPRPASATRWGRSSTRRRTSRRCVVTAGQQARALMTLQANLTNRDATRMPHPLVKWSYEPPRAEDVPLALARAIHLASLPPKGPVVRLDPDGRLGRRGRRRRRRARRSRARSTARPAADPEPLELARGRARRRRRTRRWSPGPTSTQPAPGTPRSPSPSASACRCGRRPAPGGGRIGFPEGHPHFRGVAAAGDRPGRPRRSKGHDLVLVVGSSVFPYYPNIPGPLLPEGTALVAITSDPDEAARAPMGDAIVADVAPDARGAARRRSASPTARPPEPLREPERRRGARPDEPVDGACARWRRLFPDDGIVVLESPSSTLALRNQLRLSTPGQLLLRRRRRAGLRPRRRGRRPARPARPPRRLRRSARARRSTR